MDARALLARARRAATIRDNWINYPPERERRLASALGDVAARISETRAEVHDLLATEVAW